MVLGIIFISFFLSLSIGMGVVTWKDSKTNFLYDDEEPIVFEEWTSEEVRLQGIREPVYLHRDINSFLRGDTKKHLRFEDVSELPTGWTGVVRNVENRHGDKCKVLVMVHHPKLGSSKRVDTERIGKPVGTKKRELMGLRKRQRLSEKHDKAVEGLFEDVMDEPELNFPSPKGPRGSRGSGLSTYVPSSNDYVNEKDKRVDDNDG